MHEDCLCLLGHHIQINIFIFSVFLPLGLGSCWCSLSIYKLPLLTWTQSTTEASHFHNWISAQPLMTSSHCFLHYTREWHLSHIQSTQGRLELCFRCLKEICFPHSAHTYAKHSCTAGLPCLSKEYTAIVSVFTVLSILSTDGLMELWRYRSHWHATQREVASKQTIALLTKSFSPPGFLISTASQNLIHGAKTKSHKAVSAISFFFIQRHSVYTTSTLQSEEVT